MMPTVIAEYPRNLLLRVNLSLLGSLPKLPRFFIVRSQQVAQYMKAAYQCWLKIPKKRGKGKGRNIAFRLKLNSKLHDFDLPVEKHENRWDILPK